MRLDDFDYVLPDELIAQTPLDRRSDSRLMVVNPVKHTLEHTVFHHILDHLFPGDLLVFNDSKVLPARLSVRKPDTGAVVELLLLRPVADQEWIALAKPAKRLKVGTYLEFAGPKQASSTCSAVVQEELSEGIRRIRFSVDMPFFAFLEAYGSIPLPPYIHEPLADKERYQTVYAEHLGSVAAPTAGLHFTQELLSQLGDKGVETAFVTLHVGLGTFRPVQVEEVERHVMHAEAYDVSPETARSINSARAEGRRVIAVGTTALRTLESAGAHYSMQAGVGETDIFIYPGYQFRIADALITNFHLPKSTLFMLVSAWLGLDFAKHVYDTAVHERYRFFSFGDAMFITGHGETTEAYHK